MLFPIVVRKNNNSKGRSRLDIGVRRSYFCEPICYRRSPYKQRSMIQRTIHSFI
ncbi:hypothetical protein LguiB_010760 [Lonicera macranthoides]